MRSVAVAGMPKPRFVLNVLTDFERYGWVSVEGPDMTGMRGAQRTNDPEWQHRAGPYRTSLKTEQALFEHLESLTLASGTAYR